MPAFPFIYKWRPLYLRPSISSFLLRPDQLLETPGGNDVLTKFVTNKTLHFLRNADFD